MAQPTGESDDSLERELRAALRQNEPRTDPERIGRYRVDRRLGSGGMGIVYLGYDDELRRPVALKLIRGALRFDPEARHRFRREALAASRLDHPGICYLYAIDEFEEVPYMVMRYVPGTPLSELLVSGSAVETPARCVLPSTSTGAGVLALVLLIEKIARALHEAHEQGLVHRDIKPANIMVTPEGEPVILDFGVVHDQRAEEQSLTLSGQMVGTPLYMAPEQVLGEAGAIDRRTDVFALALTLYEATTGTRPFAAPTDRGIFDNILNRDPPDARRCNRAVPRDLATVLTVGMQKDPRARFSTALEFAADLQRVREHRPIAARAPTTWVRVSRWVVRNPLAATLGVVLLAASLSVTFFWREALARERDFDFAAGTRWVRDVLQVGQTGDLVQDHTLFPAREAVIRPLEDWLASVARLTPRLPEARRAQLALQGSPLQNDLIALHRDLADEQVAVLERLIEVEVPRARARLEVARGIRRWTIEDRADDWRRAAAEIGEPDGIYRGLQIVPQLGLVPLGADPQSGLWEFAVWETGAVPQRDAAGRLSIEADGAIVLVLLGGGEFEMGDDSVERASPRHRVELSPFFIGKYEVTQGQWRRIAYHNPSTIQAGSTRTSETISDLHPVERVSDVECIEAMRRVGLELPTEAQWEFAARGGTNSKYPTGSDDLASLEGFANLKDIAFREQTNAREEVPWNDGYFVHAPVGRFEPNGFGLHDVVGNIAEWCRDWRGTYTDKVLPGTGERKVPSTEWSARVARGGSWGTLVSFGAVAARQNLPTRTSSFDSVGLRACRPLRGDE